MRDVTTWAVITIILAVLIASCPAYGEVCPRCGVDHAATVSSAQGIAQSRANYMAARDYRNHPPSSAGNFAAVGSFEGCGWSSRRNASRNTIPTCTPRGRRQLVADAVAYGARGSYRVRIWR